MRDEGAIVDKLEQWIIRLAREPTGFQVDKLGAGGLIMRGKDPLGTENIDLGMWSVRPDLDARDLADLVFDKAKENAEGESTIQKFVVLAYRGIVSPPPEDEDEEGEEEEEEGDPDDEEDDDEDDGATEAPAAFDTFKIVIRPDMETSALMKPAQYEGPHEISESRMEQMQRHAENKERSNLMMTQTLVEGFGIMLSSMMEEIKQGRAAFMSLVASAKEIADAKRSTEAAIEKERSQQETFRMIAEKVIQVGEFYVAHQMKKQMDEEEAAKLKTPADGH
jgi:hypothetical protein